MLGNNGQYYIIDSTLREGQQNSVCNFTLEQKAQFLLLLGQFGIEYAELINPNASQTAFDEFKYLINFKKQNSLRIKLIAHIRNHKDDIDRVLQLQDVDCISLVISTSSILINASHKKTIEQIIDEAVCNLKYIKNVNNNIKIRFSTEDSFRTDPNVLSKLFLAIEDYVDRIGIADTVGIATHSDIEDLITLIKNFTSSSLDIECHFHNDSSSAVYNAFIALLNGCTHINTTILGIGERNGITDLSGLISRIYTTYPETLDKYNLHFLKTLDEFVSQNIGIEIPINNPITGLCSFHHKAGIHTKSMAENTRTYQMIEPLDFGLSHKIIVFSPVMGSNCLKNFMKTHLPNVVDKLDKTYIVKLCEIIKMDIIKDSSLYHKLNKELDFAIDYILNYVS